jgi:fibronectin-binding autotransporter adhesin
VDGGVLAVGGDASLGDTALARDLVLNGGDLRVTGAFDTARKIEVRRGATVSVDGGITTSWLDLTGTGNLTKTGDGTLALSLAATGASAHSGTKFVEAGVLQGSVGALRGEIINSATVAVDVADAWTGVFTGTIRGGVFAKTGAGVLDAGGGVLEVHTITVDRGILTQSGSLRLAATAVNVSRNGTVTAPAGGGVVTQLLCNAGAIRVGYAVARNSDALGSELVVHGNYKGDGGMIYLGIGLVDGAVVADKFLVAGNAGGKTSVNFVQAEAGKTVNLPNLAADLPPDVIYAAGGGGEFVQAGRVTFGVKDYTLVYDPATGAGDWRISLSSEIPAVLGVDAAIMTTNNAALNSLGQRLESMRVADGGTGRKGWDIWLSGMWDDSKFTRTIYDGATADTRGWQAGADYSDSESAFALGGFVDRVDSDMDMPHDTGTSATVNGFGAYVTYRPGAWYFDALLRATNGVYRVNIPETPTLEMDMKGFGAALEIGREITVGKWLVEPQLQVFWQRTNVDRAGDRFGRIYNIDAIQSLTGRAGALLSRTFVPRENWQLRPYARLGYAEELDGRATMLLETIGEKITYDNDLGGGGAILNAGVALRIRDRFDLWADATWHGAGKAEGCSLNLGAGCRF